MVKKNQIIFEKRKIHPEILYVCSNERYFLIELGNQILRRNIRKS